MQLSALSLALTRAGLMSSFSPAALFTAGVTGAWYDPSDTTTLFQDAAGTLPVTAVEQPVGLMLDKRDTAYSTYFDGSGDYLTAPASSALNLTTGSWTIEGWFYGTSFPNFSNNILVKDGISGSTYPQYTLRVTSGSKLIGEIGSGTTSNSFQTLTGTTTVTANAWHHFAFTFDGSLLRLFLDGAQEISAAKTVTMGDGGAPLTIGAQNNHPNNYFNGYISNVRIVKGTALYTANFTPPTAPLTPVAGTSLLTCGTSWSGNPAITNNGNTRADKLNPFTTGTGNHAFNSSGNSANFPVLSARYNLLTKTEDFSDAVWVQYLSATKSGTSVCTINFGSGTDSAIYQTVPANSVSTQYTYSATVKSSTGKKFRFALYIGGSTVLYSPDITTTANFVTYSYTFPANALTGSPTINIMNESAGGTGQIEVKQPDLRVANDALNQPAYQRVNTATDYDTVGFKPYLRFNGTNQWLQTNSIDFTYGDKMFVSAGVRKLSDATTQMLFETSTSSTSYNGAFCLANKVISTNDYWFNSRGTIDRGASSNIAVAPITNVISGIGDISGDQSIIRINGTQAAINTGDQGTGKYGNHPLYIGARAGTSLWFNGRLYQMVVAGKQASAAEITSTETYLNQKTGAF